ncbi:glycosyltransferase [uncultured Thiocystis sp.]|jgi:glycosyltransferase involved in cell wall biosynthesis|uniref:glycosyltransferase n=1 Tax=uncultured Thiocystis sp. TaxID=1202134 RepID=UPI0025EBCDDF|nr:glycosyltransferase [uncultured Thiocystis sp.]
MIPKIIHQIWKTTDIPDAFRVFQRTWQAHHPDWEYRLWTDADSRAFLALHYPNFVTIYDAYLTPICRVDAIRYFLLKHYGGVYADLDFECLRPLGPLLDGKEVLVGLEPASHVLQNRKLSRGLSRIVCNALMASRPQHPFWDHVIGRLAACRHEPDPLDATGPFFLTRALDNDPGQGRVTVMPAELVYPADAHDCREGRLFDLEHWHRLVHHAYAIHHWAGTWHRAPENGAPLPSAQAQARLLFKGRIIADMSVHARQVIAPDTSMVSCLMVTKNRALQALCAIRCFQEQTYPALELVILDDGEDEKLSQWILGQNDERIRYYRLPSQDATLGELRNRAVALARGEYVCQWDDDDLYDPARIETQLTMIHALGADACILSRWLIWWPRRDRLAVSVPRAWEGSLLCAKACLPPYLEGVRRGEDTPVTERLMQSARVVLLDQPRLYLYVVHHGNTFDQTHFEQHWQASGLRFENESYARVVQELRKRLDLEGYLRALGHPSLATELGAETDAHDTLLVPSSEDAVSKTPLCSRLELIEHSQRAAELPSVLILTPIKNAGRFVQIFFENLLRLDYPREKLSLAFLEGDSDDDTWALLREYGAMSVEHFNRIDYFRLDFGFRIKGARWLPNLQFQRRRIISKCRNTLFQKAYQNESWILWIDADVIDYPSDVLRRLLDTGKSIVVPNCVLESSGPTFDLNTFRYKPGARAQSWNYLVDGIIQPPRGVGRLYLDDLRGQELVEVDAVGGTMLLVKAELHADGLLFPDYSYRGYLDTEGFAMRAFDQGVVSWGLPDLEIRHALD